MNFWAPPLFVQRGRVMNISSIRRLGQEGARGVAGGGGGHLQLPTLATLGSPKLERRGPEMRSARARAVPSPQPFQC